MFQKKVVAIIPARSGSKSVKDKNIRVMNGKPMIAYSIEQALASKLIDRVIVSTDSEDYKKIAEEYGAEVPFLRPAEISGDFSLDIDVFKHALEWLKENENYTPDIFVHLRPTHPIRDVKDIDAMIELLINDEEADAVRSLSPAAQTPYKMWLVGEENTLSPVATCDVKEAYNAPRQILPKAYMQNACIDVIRSSTIGEKSSMTGDKILGYPMDYDFDIDTEADFLRAEQHIFLTSCMNFEKKLTIVCDIDGVIAGKTLENNYTESFPINHNIDVINKLYDDGHKIVLYTARGYVTGIDWSDITKQQLSDWGLKYHELKFGKPNADIYIDDKFYDISILAKL